MVDTSESPISVTMKRVSAPEMKEYLPNPDHPKPHYRPEGKAPPRPPSSLPPPDDIKLHLSLGSDIIGEGACAQVFPVSVSSRSSPSHGDCVKGDLPPLVAKVTLGKHLLELTSEASVYHELEELQGICIPRCYGFFKGQIPTDCALTIGGLKFDRSELMEYEDDPPKTRTIGLLLLERLGSELSIADIDPNNETQ